MSSFYGANRPVYIAATIGSLLIVAIVRWGAEGPITEVLLGREGVKTLVLGILLAVATCILLHKALETVFPWQEPKPRNGKRAGRILDTRLGQETSPGSSASTSITVSNGAQELSAIQAQLAELKTGMSSLVDKLQAPKTEMKEHQEDGGVARALEALNSQMDAALRNAREEVERRDKTNEILTLNLSKANIQRTLARFTQALELTRAVATKVGEGKTTGADAFEFILGDLESALADNNVLFEQFPVGTRLPDLPSGSFTPVAFVDAPTPELAGTVKEAKSAAYYILESDDKRRYIAPAKLIVYKVQ